MIILGDTNLCSEKWDLPDFKYKSISEELRSTLKQCGLQDTYVGLTFLADRLSEDNQTIQSTINHVYRRNSLENNSIVKNIF